MDFKARLHQAIFVAQLNDEELSLALRAEEVHAWPVYYRRFLITPNSSCIELREKNEACVNFLVD